MKTFKELGVRADLIKSIQELGIIHPTDVQDQAIPFLIEKGGDLIAQAQTGTGKTAAFGLPLLMRIDSKSKDIQAVVVAPTRELAKQIGKQLFRYTKFSEHKIFTEVLCGGDNFDRQVAALQRPTHIVVVTPGRLIDLIQKKALTLIHVKYLVLDEADEMLSMGFKKELVKIFGLTRAPQHLAFSATIPDAINGLIKDCMSEKPHSLKIDKAHVVNRDIDHRFTICTRDEKTEFISGFLKRQKENRGVIFCRTKAGAIVLGKQLVTKGFAVAVLQGDLTQKERDTIMRSFKKERFQFLIATDVAARGIDVEGLSFVIHHQLPEQDEYYTHRSGRTARAGKKGISLTLIEPRERPKITRLENDLGLSFTEVH